MSTAIFLFSFMMTFVATFSGRLVESFIWLAVVAVSGYYAFIHNNDTPRGT